jgi:hypothetical protein
MERKLERYIRAHYNRQSNRIFKSLRDSGIQLSAVEDESELVAILEAHHIKAADTFGKRTVEDANQQIKPSRNADIKDEEIAAALLLLRTSQSKKSAEEIANGTDKRINAALKKYQDIDAAEIEYRSKLVYRSQLTAATENQLTIESTKQTVGSAIPRAIAVSSAVAVVVRQNKSWATMGDKDVRPWHQNANGQTVATDKPFIVGGEELMFPGDRSKSSVKNWIHCRCVSLLAFFSS